MTIKDTNHLVGGEMFVESNTLIKIKLSHLPNNPEMYNARCN